MSKAKQPRQRKTRSDKGIKKPVDKSGAIYLKYRDMAIEFIKSGYTNMRAIYKQYHPKSAWKSVEGDAYRLLANATFKAALEDAYTLINIKDLDIARDVLACLHKEMTTASNSRDRTNAASWLGKAEALFTEKIVMTNVESDEDYQFTANRLSEIRGNVLQSIELGTKKKVT